MARADFDVVGDLAGAHPVDQVAERSAGDEADRDPHPRGAGVAGEEEADEAEREDGEDDQRRVAAAGQAERNALVVGEGEPERAQDVHLLAGDEVVLDHGLDYLVEDDDESAERARQAPGAHRGAAARPWVAHPRIRPTTTASTTKRTISAITGAKLKAMPPPPTDGTRRRKTLR